MKEELISVGIDIGTSTTQLVFSKLYIENTASAFNVPRVEIVEREIVYKSDIYITPLLDINRIDVQKVKEIIDTEYKKAGMSNEMIASGAAIITGETARKENAREVLAKMSSYAGDFVVATAGPDLEGVIAGKGAKANILSKELRKNVVNIDIGGGTSNLVLFCNGEAKDTGCFDIGGRLIRLDEGKKVDYISPKIKEIIEKEKINIEVSKKLDLGELEKITAIMSDVLLQSVGLMPKGKYYDLLITNKGLELEDKVDGVTFSGGVSEYIYRDEEDKDIFKYNDIGIALARAIRKTKLCQDEFLLKSAERIRATVIGAGTHTTSLSGSTIFFNENEFPIKNLPVIKISKEDEKTKESMEASIRKKLGWFLEDYDNESLVIAFEGDKSPSFKRINEYADAIIEGTKELKNNTIPLIVITKSDIGKALGQTILSNKKSGKKIISLDGLSLEDGDYVDLGKPAHGGMVMTVVIKTLVF